VGGGVISTKGNRSEVKRERGKRFWMVGVIRMIGAGRDGRGWKDGEREVVKN